MPKSLADALQNQQPPPCESPCRFYSLCSMADLCCPEFRSYLNGRRHRGAWQFPTRKVFMRAMPPAAVAAKAMPRKVASPAMPRPRVPIGAWESRRLSALGGQ